MAETTVTIEERAADEIRRDAQRTGQKMKVFIPAMHRAWRSLPEKKQWQFLQEENEARADSAAE